MAEERIDGIDSVRKLVESPQPDVLRELLQTIVTQLMSAEADGLCEDGYGERSAERVNSRNEGLGHADGHDGAGDPEAASFSAEPARSTSWPLPASR